MFVMSVPMLRDNPDTSGIIGHPPFDKLRVSVMVSQSYHGFPEQVGE